MVNQNAKVLFNPIAGDNGSYLVSLLSGFTENLNTYYSFISFWKTLRVISSILLILNNRLDKDKGMHRDSIRLTTQSQNSYSFISKIKLSNVRNFWTLGDFNKEQLCKPYQPCMP